MLSYIFKMKNWTLKLKTCHFTSISNEICRYKSNNICMRSIWELQNSNKKIKYLNKWRAISFSWIKILNNVKMSVLPIWSIDTGNSNKNPSNIIFGYIDKLIVKCIYKIKSLWIANTILKKIKVGKLTLPNFKTYYIATITKTMWCWWKIQETNKLIKWTTLRLKMFAFWKTTTKEWEYKPQA